MKWRDLQNSVCFDVKSPYLRTTDLARAVGIHPNTVRRYVERGWLPPVERSPAGYRRFTARHLTLLRLAHRVYGGQHPGLVLRLSAARIVRAAVTGDLAEAHALANRHLELVQAERAQANLAADLLEHWASGKFVAIENQPLQIGQVAHLLGVSIDMLRNWDRSGLIEVPRDPANGYRRYGAYEISRLRVIRLLSRAGYSLSAILRMLIRLDEGERSDLRHTLDTPRPDEDAYLASDRWLSTLAAEEQRAQAILTLLDEIIHQQTAEDC